MHRIGIKGKTNCRPIIIEFVSYRYRNLIYKNKHFLKGTKLAIGENLTKQRLELLKAAISKFSYKNVWSMDGTIFIKFQGNVHVIISVENIGSVTQVRR